MSRKNGDWTILKTEKIFENDFLTLSEDKVIRPDGEPGKYATIRFVRGSSILPIDDEGNIYITDQFRYALGRKDIEVASGAIENDEQPIETAKREVFEELGIEAEEWIEMSVVESNTSITDSRAYLFLARGLTFHRPDQEGSEDIDIIKMPLEEAVQKVMSGEITHDQTVALVLKAHIHLRK